jgi:hypothetical protein
MNVAAPAIAPEGVSDIIAKIATLTFESGMDVSVAAAFDEHNERVQFSLEAVEPAELAGGLEQFLTAVRANQDEIAYRLAGARDLARITGTEQTVDLTGLSDVPSWPILSITAGPVPPEGADTTAA